MHVTQVGQPYPGPVPPHDGLFFEIGPDGNMVLIIQWHRPTDADMAALQAGFERYALHESGTIHLAAWAFKFPAPVRYVDAPLHAGLYQDDRAQKFLDHDDWNSLEVYVLDGPIVRVIRLVGLQHQAAHDFREIVKRQLAEPISPITYDAAVNDLYRHDSEELFRRGTQYKHGGSA